MLKYDLLEKAYRYHDVAEHLLTVTFPLAKDPKLLLGVLDNLALASETLMEAVLSAKKEFSAPDFISRLVQFRRYVSKEEADLIGQLHELNQLHKTCPVEFRRGNTLVMCTSGYEMRTLSLPQIKDYRLKVKELIESNKKQ